MTDARAMRGPYPEPLGVNRSNFAALEGDDRKSAAIRAIRARPAYRSFLGDHGPSGHAADYVTRLIIDTGLVWRDNTSTRF